MAIPFRDILSKEATNKSNIYLYEQGDKWVAYERSAYLFSQIFKTGEIRRLGGRVCIAISRGLDFLQSKAMSSVQITSVGDSELEINCASTFPSFE